MTNLCLQYILYRVLHLHQGHFRLAVCFGVEIYFRKKSLYKKNLRPPWFYACNWGGALGRIKYSPYFVNENLSGWDSICVSVFFYWTLVLICYIDETAIFLLNFLLIIFIVNSFYVANIHGMRRSMFFSNTMRASSQFRLDGCIMLEQPYGIIIIL